MHMPREVQSEMCASAVLVTVRGGRDDSMTTLGKWLLQCSAHSAGLTPQPQGWPGLLLPGSFANLASERISAAGRPWCVGKDSS